MLMVIENKKQLYALVCETLKYYHHLEKISEECSLPEHLQETENLAVVLLYEEILGWGLHKAGKLKNIITQHRDQIESVKVRLLTDNGVCDFRDLCLQDSSNVNEIPRYVRVNLLKTSVPSVIAEFVDEGWSQVECIDGSYDMFIEKVRNLQEDEFMKDLFLWDVLIFPPGTDLHDHVLCQSGQIILQDKASCIPAHVLSVPEGSTVLDSCAAPGNKTSHVVSLLHGTGQVYAFDRDQKRMSVMRELMKKVGAHKYVDAQCQDFLRLNPRDYMDVQYVLVDPSCSGSGIVGRLNHVTSDLASESKDRLKSLSNFQALLLKHALRFPNVRRVVYSTCSVHEEENEQVVDEVYEQVEKRFGLDNVIPEWPCRGKTAYMCGNKCIRLVPNNDLTNGFFVACFVRKHQNDNSLHDSDDRVMDPGMKVKKKKRKKKSQADNIHQTSEQLPVYETTAHSDMNFGSVSKLDGNQRSRNTADEKPAELKRHKKKKKKRKIESGDFNEDVSLKKKKQHDCKSVVASNSSNNVKKNKKCKKKRRNKKRTPIVR